MRVFLHESCYYGFRVSGDDSGRRAPRQKFWIIEDRAGYRLQRIPEHNPGRRMSREEVLRAIRDCELTFPRDWEEIRAETCEP